MPAKIPAIAYFLVPAFLSLAACGEKKVADKPAPTTPSPANGTNGGEGKNNLPAEPADGGGDKPADQTTACEGTAKSTLGSDFESTIETPLGDATVKAKFTGVIDIASAKQAGTVTITHTPLEISNKAVAGVIESRFKEGLGDGKVTFKLASESAWSKLASEKKHNWDKIGCGGFAVTEVKGPGLTLVLKEPLPVFANPKSLKASAAAKSATAVKFGPVAATHNGKAVNVYVQISNYKGESPTPAGIRFELFEEGDPDATFGTLDDVIYDTNGDALALVSIGMGGLDVNFRKAAP